MVFFYRRFIDSIQQTFQTTIGGPGMPDNSSLDSDPDYLLTSDTTDDGLSDDLAIEMPPQVQLPPPDLGVLAELDNNIRSMSQSPSGRDALAKAIMTDDYISMLIPLGKWRERRYGILKWNSRGLHKEVT